MKSPILAINNPLPQHKNLKQQKSKSLQKKLRLLRRLINSFPCISCALKVKPELTHQFANINTSAIAVQYPVVTECCTVS